MTKIIHIIVTTVFYTTSIFCQATETSVSQFCGEQLNYEMTYLNLKVATLNFSIEDTKNDTSQIYQLTVSAKSVGLATSLFKINNQYTTLFGVTNFLPIRSVKIIEQKNIRHRMKLDFLHRQSKICLNDTIFWDTHEPCYDYFSMLYFLRSQSWIKSDKLTFFLDSESLISRVEAQIVQRNKLLKVAGNEFNSFKLMITFFPVNNEKRPWKTDLITNRLAKPGSKLEIWFSDDENRLPLKIVYNRSLVKTQLELTSFLLTDLN